MGTLFHNLVQVLAHDHKDYSGLITVTYDLLLSSIFFFSRLFGMCQRRRETLAWQREKQRCVIVSRRIIMSIPVRNTQTLLY